MKTVKRCRGWNEWKLTETETEGGAGNLHINFQPNIFPIYANAEVKEGAIVIYRTRAVKNLNFHQTGSAHKKKKREESFRVEGGAEWRV